MKISYSPILVSKLKVGQLLLRKELWFSKRYCYLVTNIKHRWDTKANKSVTSAACLVEFCQGQAPKEVEWVIKHHIENNDLFDLTSGRYCIVGEI